MKFHRVVFSLLGSLLLLPSSLFPRAIVQAQPVDQTTLNGQALPPNLLERPWYNAPDLAGRGAPSGRRRGLSSRGDCKVIEPHPLTALAPATQAVGNSEAPDNGTNTPAWNLTTQARPAFWFYVPYYLDTVPLTFVLQDADNNTLYETSLSSNGHDRGIVQVPLPESVPALQLNNRYHWFLALQCDPLVLVHGSIDRVPLDPALQLPLAEATLRDQAVIYARHGLWPEAVTLLGELYRADLDNISRANDWYSLLESVGLEDIAQQPLIDCCTP